MIGKLTIEEIGGPELQLNINSNDINVKLKISFNEIKAFHKVLGQIVDVNTPEAINFEDEVNVSNVEDLTNLSDRDMQSLLREITSMDLIAFIKVTREMKMDEFENKVIINMSKRASKMLLEDLDALTGISRESAVESGRVIYESALRLATTGEILLGAGKGATF